MNSAINFLKILAGNSIKKIDKTLDKNHKHFNDLIKELLSKQTIFAEQTRKKKIEKLKSSLTKIYKCYFDKKTFCNDVFESVIKNNFIMSLTSYLEYQITDVSDVILPVLLNTLYDNGELLNSIGLDEEVLLVNKQSIDSVKNLIIIFNILISENPQNELIEKYIINFVNILFEKFMLYPNYYYAISSPKDLNFDNNNFDSNLFKLIINLFSVEHFFQDRNNKKIIRKSLMKCLNLEYFYTVNASLIERLLEILVDNLITYYQNFILFEGKKYKSFINNINNNTNFSISDKDLNKIITDDTISYLKFFSMITHCFAMSDLKDYLSNILFNTFFCEYIQKDIIILEGQIKYNNKPTKILEFIYYFTEYVNNYELCEMLFYFLFGFNLYNTNNNNEIDDEEDVEDNKNLANYLNNNNVNCKEQTINKEFFLKKNLLDNNETGLEIMITDPEDLKNNDNNNNSLQINKVKNDVKKHLRFSNIKTFSSNVNLNIEKSNHNFENILGFFQFIIESKNSKNKSLLLNILSNIASTIPYVFMTELIVPYYLNYLYNNYKSSYEKICDNLKKTNEKIDIIEILKTIHPKSFSINANIWTNYFQSSMENNYINNINMLNRIDNSYKTNNKNNLIDDTLFGENISNTNNFLTLRNINNYDYYSNTTITNLSTTRDYLTTNVTNNNNFNIDDNSDLLNNDVSFNYMLNNYTINLRNKFFDCLLRAIKNYCNNKYVDNLYYTKLFTIISSIPYVINKGENGDQYYNIYTNVTYAGKKKRKLFEISMVGIMSKIKKELDDDIRLKYSRDEINKFTTFKDNNNNENDNSNNQEYFNNVILFNEVYKEFISTLFTKACIDQINFGWSKKIIKFDN